MHFTFSNQDSIFTIRAGLMPEHGDSNTGLRIQDDKAALTLLENAVSFGLDIKDIDNDHVAMSAILMFLPFIGDKVSFTFPVSDAIANFLQDPALAEFRGKPPIKVITKVSGQRQATDFNEIKLEDCALAIGGGFDAVALKSLFPEIYSYHCVSTAVLNHVYHYPAYTFYRERATARIGEAPIADDYIWTNAENIVKPRGVMTWANFGIPALLMARQRGTKCIMSGTIFESAYLHNGTHFDPYPNIFEHDFLIAGFHAIGVSLVTAGIMLPEYATAREVFRAGLADKLSFCIMGVSGGPCGKCFKCYRKKLMYETCKAQEDIHVAQLDSMDISAFDIPYIITRTNMKPMPFSSTFKWMSRRVDSKYLTDNLKAATDALPEVKFDLRAVYGPGIDTLPASLQQVFRDRLRKRHYRFHTDDEIAAIKAWDVRPSKT